MKRNFRISIFLLFLLSGAVAGYSQEQKSNALAIIEKSINEEGLSVAREKFDNIMSDRTKYIILENEFNSLGYRFVNQRRYEEAIAVLTMNIEAFPESSDAYNSLGGVYSWMGNNELAIKHLEKSLELNPGNEAAIMNLSRIYGTISDFENETRSENIYNCGESTGINKPYLGEEPPGLIPKLFAPGIISTNGNFEFACTFTPDGREFYFTRRSDNGGVNVIMVSYWKEDGWTAPDTAEFSLAGWNNEPHITPDGSSLYFGTTRVKPGADNPSYGIWVMDREGDGWSYPRFAIDGMYVSSSNRGSIYLTDIYEQAGGGIVRYINEDNIFTDPVKLGGGVNRPVNGIHPSVSPDEEFILFDCYRKEGFGGEGDLYVSFRNEDGEWGEAINLGEHVNGKGTDFCASLSPDGMYIFFTRNRDIYWVSAEVVRQLKPGE